MDDIDGNNDERDSLFYHDEQMPRRSSTDLLSDFPDFVNDALPPPAVVRAMRAQYLVDAREQQKQQQEEETWKEESWERDSFPPAGHSPSGGDAMTSMALFQGMLKTDEAPPDERPRSSGSVGMSAKNLLHSILKMDDVPLNEDPPSDGVATKHSSLLKSMLQLDDGPGMEDDGDDTLDALAAKACALASVPIPNYSDAFGRKDQKYKTKKYRDKDLQRASREDLDPSSILLAGKTSNIMNEFQDYLTEIETQSPGANSILNYRPARGKASVTLTRAVPTKMGGGKDERRGVILTEWDWDKYEGQSKRRPSLEALRKIFENNSNLRGDADSTDGASVCTDLTPPKSREKRGYCNYKHSILHSKKLKVGIAWTIVLCVLIGAIIGILSAGNNNEDVQQEYLERVEGLGKHHKEDYSTTAITETRDEDFEELENINEKRDEAWGSKGDHQEGQPAGKPETQPANQKHAEDENNNEVNAKTTLPQKDVGPTTNSDPSNPTNNEVEITTHDDYLVGSPTKEEPQTETPGAVDDDDKSQQNVVQQQDVVAMTTFQSPTPPPAPLLPAPTHPPSPWPPAPTPPPFPLPPVPTPPTASSDMTSGSESVTVTLIYNLEWYDRLNGWTGQTYDEAISFCTKQGVGYNICPYEAYCPVSNGIPSGGARSGGSWAPVNDDFNEWVRVGDDERPCVRYTMANNHKPGWGLTGEHNEEFTRHIACCAGAVLPMETTTVDSGRPATSLHDQMMLSPEYREVVEKYAPEWHHRDEASDGGWTGKSYTDALAYCAQQDSSIPCPYEAYCPHGAGHTPFEGSRGTPESPEVWSPIMDIPNGWVMVGPTQDTCKLYTSLHSNPPWWGLVGHHTLEEESQYDAENVKAKTSDIMCCREPPEGDRTIALQVPVPGPIPAATTKYEQDILDKKHPIWFSRKEGYHGTTHEEAAEFCESIVGGMTLCPAESYCPEGNTNPDRPLFLQTPAMKGEQWAPVATVSANSNEKWLLVGELDGESSSTCSTFDEVRGMKPKGYDLNGADPDLKKHVMCCMKSNHLSKETNFAKDLGRIWLDESFGWKGGSHDDAKELCGKLGVKKRLCPYTAYCPHGPGRPVVGGHSEDFNIEGEQWAPMNHDSNLWVLIGRKYQNSATTCMSNIELEGQVPSWGTSNERPELKNHIMCCEY